MVFWDGTGKLLKGNLHMHTKMSDGQLSPDEALDIYRAKGYDFVALTDHREVKTPTYERNGILAIKALEFDYSMPGQVMHILGIGVNPDIIERAPLDIGPQRAIDEVNAQGGVAVLAHPAWSLNTPAIICALSGLCAVEIYNTVSGLPWNADRADSSHIIDECLTSGMKMRLVATDDAHFYNGDECQSYIWLKCENNTEADIIAALKKGDFYATRGPRIERIELDGDVLKVDCSPAKYVYFPSELPWSRKRVVKGDGITHAEYKLEALNHRYVRVVVEDENGKRAWSNPIFLDR